MEVAIFLGIIAVVCVGLGIWSQSKIGTIPENYVSNEFPLPQVAFPFEPLTELATECCAKFTEMPLLTVPAVFISPAAYFGKDVNAAYRPENDSIYFKDTYVNNASSESLKDAMLRQVLCAWLWQRKFWIIGNLKIDDRIFTACYDVASVFMGLKKSVGQGQSEIWEQTNV